MNNNIKEKLIDKAKTMRQNAYSPYSKFKVGAAVLTQQDNIYGGCNIENVSFGLTNCAERTAVFKAVSAGETKIKALALVGGDTNPVSPCGACRQVISEFAVDNKDFLIIMAAASGKIVEYNLDELFPEPFMEEF